MKRLFATLIFAIALTGCPILPDAGTTEALGVNYLLGKATQQFVDGSGERRARVLDAVADARQYIEAGESVTVAALYEGALARLDGMDPLDKQALITILANAKGRLETAISAGALDPDERVVLLDTLKWIEAAAR